LICAQVPQPTPLDLCILVDDVFLKEALGMQQDGELSWALV
jgi:hypothetical protein